MSYIWDKATGKFKALSCGTFDEISSIVSSFSYTNEILNSYRLDLLTKVKTQNGCWHILLFQSWELRGF